MRLCLNLVRIYAILSAPLIPETSEKMLAKFGLKSQDMPTLKNFNIAEQINTLKEGTPFEVGEALFERITPERATELQQKYGGD